MVLTGLDGLASAAEDARGAGADEEEDEEDEEDDDDDEEGDDCDGEDAVHVDDDSAAFKAEADVERQRERINAEPWCAEVEACADERLRNRPATPLRQP